MPELVVPGAFWLLIASCRDEHGAPIGSMSFGWHQYDPPSQAQIDEMIDTYARPHVDAFLASEGVFVGPPRRLAD